MITKKKKAEIIADLVEKFKKTNSYYLIDFMGLNVADTINLRREFKSKGIEMTVAKNTLMLRAMDETSNNAIPREILNGPSALLFAYEDPVAPAKIIKQRLEKSDLPKLKAAVIEGVFYDGSRLKELAVLPTKPEMIGSILSSLNAPVSGIIGSMNAILRDIAYVIEEVAKKQAS